MEKDFYRLLTPFGTVKDAFKTRLLESIMPGLSLRFDALLTGQARVQLNRRRQIVGVARSRRILRILSVRK